MRVSFLLPALLSLPAFGQPNLLNTLELTLINGDIPSPTAIVHAGDGSNRLFVTERAGRIWILDANRQKLNTPFLDIHTQVGSLNGEQGLLGLAFHPNYESNSRFFVNYTDLNGDTVVSQFLVSANANVANAGGEQIYFATSQPFTNHNGGQLQFGPDGMLYVAMGDGGSGGDPDNYAQTLSSPLGKLLRFDVDQGVPAVAPDDNPFVDTPGALDAIWAVGLRNPWRFSFDRSNGDMWIADVGQQQWEEVNFAPAGATGGLNYGWRLMEGAHCFNPPAGCNNGSLILPVIEYQHVGGACSVTGGYRYRGAQHPVLNGTYFFAEFCGLTLRAAVETTPGTFQVINPRNIGGSISTFGEDESGEIYFATYYDGRIYRIDGPPQGPDVAQKVGALSSTRWMLDQNGNGVREAVSDFNYTFSLDGAQRLVGDWNGDGRDEIGLFFNGFWFLDYNGNGVWEGPSVDRQYNFGWAGVTPLVGDWNDSGRDKVGIFLNGFWYLDADGDGLWDGPVVDKQAHFGWPGVTPFVGDWNGDGADKIGIFLNGFWYLDYNGNGTWQGPATDRYAEFGWTGVTPLLGDWDGDGRKKIGVFINGFWFLDADGDGQWDGPGIDIQTQFGSGTMLPVAGDWNADGSDEIGTFANGFWFLDFDGSNAWDGGVNDKTYHYGQPGETPIFGRW